MNCMIPVPGFNKLLTFDFDFEGYSKVKHQGQMVKHLQNEYFL